MKSVSDKELNELLQQALKYDDTLLIDEEIVYVKKGWFSKVTQETKHKLFHESRSVDGKPYQAQYMLGVDGGVLQITAYLMGIINGGEAMKRKLENEQRKIN